MDFRTIFQLRNKKVWWMDVIFYFAISLLVATILCYLVFLIKNIIQKKQIQAVEEALLTVGTQDQLKEEEQVILYKKKFNDFDDILKNHSFGSNIFAFMQDNTQPKIWFKQFSLDAKEAKVQLSGKADDMDMVSRQIASFEKNEYVKNIDNINSTLAEDAKIEFNFNLALNPEIFSYALNVKNKEIEEAEKEIIIVTGSLSTTEVDIEENTETNQTEELEPQKNSEKLIFSFTISTQSGEIIGYIDQTNHTILLELPTEIDINNITPNLIISDRASVYPQSGTPQSFNSPVVYQVIAEDGTSQDYVVTAKIVKTNEEKVIEQNKEKRSNIFMIFLAIAIMAFIAMISLIGFLYFKNKKGLKGKGLFRKK